jgi:hypothetical protein
MIVAINHTPAALATKASAIKAGHRPGLTREPERARLVECRGVGRGIGRGARVGRAARPGAYGTPPTGVVYFVSLAGSYVAHPIPRPARRR